MSDYASVHVLIQFGKASGGPPVAERTAIEISGDFQVDLIILVSATQEICVHTMDRPRGIDSPRRRHHRLGKNLPAIDASGAARPAPADKMKGAKLVEIKKITDHAVIYHPGEVSTTGLWPPARCWQAKCYLSLIPTQGLSRA